MDVTIHSVSKIKQKRKIFKNFTVIELKVTDTKDNDQYISMYFKNDKKLKWESLPDEDCT
jgi:hypothetical protein